MSQALISELERAAKQSTAERIASELRERACLFAAEKAKSEAGIAARRRSELLEGLELAAAGEQAARDRLGPCRLAHADAERELEKLADTAALGSDPAARSIAKARDAVETAASIVAAHERHTLIMFRPAYMIVA